MVTLLRHRVVGMYLHGEVLPGVDELDEQRKLVAVLRVNGIAQEGTLVAVDELWQRDAHIGIGSQSTVRHHTLVVCYPADFPALADAGSVGLNALKGGDALAPPKGFFQIRFEFEREKGRPPPCTPDGERRM